MKETFIFDWKNAEVWQENENEKLKYNVKWRFDCGFKLDFDGGLVSVESRFYPPHKNGHDEWEGNMNFYVCKKEWCVFNIKKPTLEQIKKEAYKILKRQSEIIESLILNK